MNIKDYLEQKRDDVDRFLDSVIPSTATAPITLHESIRYSLMAGGKRVRPILAIAAAEAVGQPAPGLMPIACSLELIHTYSLIHDDLPAMDNDDFRRGAPTNHKVFGEAMAILAGDALLTLAFRLVADNAATSAPAALREVVTDIADAAGHRGMVAGQVADIEAEGRQVGAEVVDYIHAHKTGALIRTSLRVGAMLCGADAAQVRALSVAGADLGLAFQIVDDILDVVSSTKELGKTAGKDQAQQKATYPAIHGIEASRARAAFLIRDAEDALRPLGRRAEPIRALGRFIVERKA